MTLSMLGLACEPTPTPSPTFSGPAASEATHASPEPTPSPTDGPVAPTTASERIQLAVAEGRLDPPTGILYRVWATFGDPRLPAEYEGEPTEDLEAIEYAAHELETFPSAVKDQLLPYLVRPADPLSYWNLEPESARAETGVSLASWRQPNAAPAVAPNAPACQGLWMHDRVGPFVPIMIWTQCTGGEAAALQTLEKVRAYMDDLWIKEIAVMGAPVGDQNIAGDAYPDTPESGDGLIDFYVLSSFTPAGTPRDLTVRSNFGVARQVPPFEGTADAEHSSGYVVIGPASGTDRELQATLAHEFFHVLQFDHNARGIQDCPILSLGSCPNVPQKLHWFVEASATWAEHQFVPAGRSDYPYPRYREFLATALGLSNTDGLNAYASWGWPLFLQQEASAQRAVGDAWVKIEGKKGWRQVQAGLNSQLGFTEHFRDFAVEVWNLDLAPDPQITKRFADLDPTFPAEHPSGSRLSLLDENEIFEEGSRIYGLGISSLASKYFLFEPGYDVYKLTFDFVALSPEIDVDALVMLETGEWERRKLPQGEVEWCLDNPDDAIVQGILVFSNHDQEPGSINRQWSVKGETSCGDPEGTLRYSFLDTAPILSQPGGHQTIDANVQVRLKLNENIADPYVAMYLNDGSTYGVGTSSKVLMPVSPDGCQSTMTSSGMPGGPLAVDSVVGNTWVDEEGKNRLTLGISLPVHEETRESWCALGTTRSTSETTVNYPTCDGVESSSTRTSQTFDFDCDFQGTTQSWSISGTIVIIR